MLGLQELPVSLSLLGEQCQVSTGAFSPLISPMEANAVTTCCYNPAGENIITCMDDRKENFLAEVSGLELNTKLKSNIDISNSYIPIFDYRTIEQAYNANLDMVGLNLSSILKSPIREKAGVYIPQKIVFRDMENITRLCEKKKVILFLTGPDALIEWIWYHRDICELFLVLQQMKFWAVTGFNFSVFGGECPFAQALNQKRSLYSSLLIEQQGLLTVPHVYAINEFHMTRYQEWLSINSHVSLITVNCQMQRSRIDIYQVVKAVSELLFKNPNLHVLLQGFHLNEAYRFGILLNRIHFADAKACKYGQNFKRIKGLQQDLAEMTENPKMDYSEMVTYNIIARKQEFDRVRLEFGKI